MNKTTRVIAAFIAAMMLMCGFAGCSIPEPADEGEMLAAAKTLLESAVEVNRIFFWEGLPHEEPAEDKLDVGDSEYLVLTEDYMYLMESDLMAKAEAVYSEAYCKDIEKIAFEGIKVTEDEALFARYIVEQGIMKINRKLSEEGLSERLPDTSTMETVSITHNTAVVSVSFTGEGVTEKQEIKLVLEDDGWRLDTPTY
ncbi:MAG: hypothetical protein IJ386_06480 [Clostridia bacterium]|nr:hypothetical protein [Clostridia bacterium]